MPSENYIMPHTMKWLIFILIGLVGWAANAAEKICLPTNIQSSPLSDIGSLPEVQISSEGRWLLYRKTKKPVTLLDLKTGEKTEFLPPPFVPDNNIFVPDNNIYGFSDDGTLAWGWLYNKQLKVRHLSDGEERILSTKRNDFTVIRSELLKGGKILWSLGYDENQWKSVHKAAENLEKRKKAGEKKEVIEEEFYNLARSIKFISLLTDLTSFSESDKTISGIVNNPCGAFDRSSLSWITVQRDGSINQIPLTDKGHTAKLFGSVENFEMTIELEETIKRCAFSGEGLLNIIRTPEGYLLRVIKEKKEFSLPGDIFDLFIQDNSGEIKRILRTFDDFLGDVMDFIHYPFIVTKSGIDKWNIYHLPTGQSWIRDNVRLIYTGLKGLFAFEGIKIMEGKTRFQAVSQPFDLARRRILLDFDVNEVCHFSFNKERNLAFLNTIWGDLYLIDVETGFVRRRFVGRCLDQVKISALGGTILFQDRHRNKIAQRFEEICFDPKMAAQPDIQRILSQVAEMDDLRNASFLNVPAAFASGAGESHPELALQALWGLLRHSPLLFYHFYRYFPSLDRLSAFVDSHRDLDPKRKARLRVNSLFLLKFLITENPISRLTDWKFLALLRPFLNTLSERDRDQYIEEITVSITNGATTSIPLFRDVFQSKLYYTVQGHVKELFGLKRQPVSDITIVRTKNLDEVRAQILRSRRQIENHSLPEGIAESSPVSGEGEPNAGEMREADFGQEFLNPPSAGSSSARSLIVPLILASDPIQAVPDISTDFGIHYALVERGIRPVLKQAEAGGKILDDLVEWNLSNGKYYRAGLSVWTDYIKNGIIAASQGPDYDSVWWDHKMVGLVILGSSLRGFSRTLVEEYLSYFQEQGFQFSQTETSNLKTFLLEGIKNCEVDYFLKESHSDGDERNIFRFDRVNHIAQGVRYGDQGRIEVVYIVFPPPFQFQEVKTDLLSNLELGQAMRERELQGCGQLTYFNTSCWSHVKARYEIEAVNSSLFLNIPSTSLSDTFLNIKGEAIHSLLHSYRNGLNFAGFRKELENNEGYKSRKSNLYIFPDERAYHEAVFEFIHVPLKIQIKLERKDGNRWQALDPDEAL